MLEIHWHTAPFNSGKTPWKFNIYRYSQIDADTVCNTMHVCDTHGMCVTCAFHFFIYMQMKLSVLCVMCRKYIFICTCRITSDAYPKEAPRPGAHRLREQERGTQSEANDVQLSAHQDHLQLSQPLSTSRPRNTNMDRRGCIGLCNFGD